MKAKFLFVSAASILVMTSSIAFADPKPFTFEIQCPVVGDGLSNYGDYIAGYGHSQINHQDNSQIYFKSKSSIEGVPAQLDDYLHSGVKYNSTNGDVTCAYVSGMGEKPFEVTYTLTNGKGGKAEALANDKINITIPIGLKS